MVGRSIFERFSHYALRIFLVWNFILKTDSPLGRRKVKNAFLEVVQKRKKLPYTKCVCTSQFAEKANFANNMADKPSKKAEGALKFAKDQMGDIVTGVQYVGTLDDTECYEPIFIGSPEYGVGFPFFILLKNGKYRTTTEEEYNKFASLC